MIQRNEDDIRWNQRFSNFERVYRQLEEAIALRNQRPLSRLEQQGLIKAFEFTQELAWNVMKDFFEYQGNTGITGSRDAMREAFRRGLIEDGEGWMDTITSRNRSTLTYDEDTATQLAKVIATRHLALFEKFRFRMQELASEACR